MMPKLNRSVLEGVLLVAVSGLLLTGPAHADADTGWQLRFHLAAIDFDEGSDGQNRLPGGWRYDIDIGGGVGLNAEYRFSRRLGFDMGLLLGGGFNVEARTLQVGQVTTAAYDTVSFTPLTAGLDIHLTPDSRVDFYACPMIALVHYGSLAVHTGVSGTTTRIDFDQDFALGAALGLGVPFGERRWSFQANLSYLDASVSGSSGEGVIVSSDNDATILGLGIGYRF
jgi:hypothetical protein